VLLNCAVSTQPSATTLAAVHSVRLAAPESMRVPRSPLFLYALPMKTGTNLLASVALRMAAFSSAASIGSSDRNSSASWSSTWS